MPKGSLGLFFLVLTIHSNRKDLRLQLTSPSDNKIQRTIAITGSKSEANRSLLLQALFRIVFALPSGMRFGEVHFVVAEVVWATYSESILNERGRIDPTLLEPVGRLGLRSFISAGEKGIFSIERVSWEEFLTKSDTD